MKKSLLRKAAALVLCLVMALTLFPERVQAFSYEFTGTAGEWFSKTLILDPVDDQGHIGYIQWYSPENPNLPPGLKLVKDDFYVSLEGTPSAPGTYTFEIDVTIDYPAIFAREQEKCECTVVIKKAIKPNRPKPGTTTPATPATPTPETPAATTPATPATPRDACNSRHARNPRNTRGTCNTRSAGRTDSTCHDGTAYG